MHPLDILFWSCLALGGAYLVFTVLLGGLSHAAGHISHMGDSVHLPGHGAAHGHHVSHGHVDAGHAHHVDAHHVDAHHGHHDSGQGDGDDSSGRFSIMAFINPMAMSGLLLGFGATGILARFFKAAPTASGIAAGLGGMCFWLIAWLLATRVFAAAEATSHTRREEILGLRGTVTAPISGSQAGMVSLTIGGTRQQVRAVTEEEDPIPVGAHVRIRHLDDHTAQVIRLQ